MNAEQVRTLDSLFARIYDACEELSDFNESVCDERISKASELFMSACNIVTTVLCSETGE